MEKHLHIVSLTVPYPPNFGGVIDLFWKLPALQKQGILIHLHCFVYDRAPAPELEQYCYKVHYYKRGKGLLSLLSSLPYIVKTRISKELVDNLLQDDYPILFEGVHTTGILLDERFKNRISILRLHNVEHEYYSQIASHSKKIFKKWYCQWEAKKLITYEKQMSKRFKHIFAVSQKDAEAYKNLYSISNVSYLPLFIPEQWQQDNKVPVGSYCLYHGDLSVSTNAGVAEWLLTEIFNKVDIPLVIAGKNPSPQLVHLAHVQNNTCLVANPSNTEMHDLISRAQLNILPSKGNAGIKLKLINALYNGKYCLVNTDTVLGTGLQDLCVVCDDKESMLQKLHHYFNSPFNQQLMDERKQKLNQIFNNNMGVEKILGCI